MSHVVDMDLPIIDLGLLIEAAQDVGLEVRHKNTFHWYGTHVGDYPLPVGFSKEDMGRCDLALGVKGKPEAYEIGVVKRRDGQPGYTMLFDFFADGYGLMEKIGENGGLLKQAYNTRVLIKEARRNGYRVSESLNQDGSRKISIRS